LLRSEKDGSFSLPFRFISLRSKNYGRFSLLFRFVFASFHFRFASDFYVLHECETSEKSTVFRIEAKKISLPFRFILLRSENDGAPYSQAVLVGITVGGGYNDYFSGYCPCLSFLSKTTVCLSFCIVFYSLADLLCDLLAPPGHQQIFQ
jgi:hypothetical protein